MGRDRSWVVRITTAECAVELRCGAGGFGCVVWLCGFAVGCEDTGFCPLRIMWCAPEHQYPQKTLNYKAFWGVFLFSGYKLATLAIWLLFGTVVPLIILSSWAATSDCLFGYR